MTIQQRRELAQRLVKVIAGIASPPLRVSFLRSVLQGMPLELVAEALDEVALQSDQGVGPAKDVLVSLVTLAQQPDVAASVRVLRSVATRKPLYGLSRFLPPIDERHMGSVHTPGERKGTERERRVPDYGKGRALTLGERKALARRPERKMLDRLLADPHPMVIRHVLRNPVTTEDDVVRLASRRPIAGEILREVAADTRWGHRPRVRMAVVLNPHCPLDLGLSLVQLLRPSELRVMLRVGDCRRELVRAASNRLQRPVASAVDRSADDPYD